VTSFSPEWVIGFTGMRSRTFAYMPNPWQGLTCFLRKPGAPIDNNIAEQTLKRALIQRKNSLFYKIDNGAHIGDLSMSLIHTAEHCDVTGSTT